MSAQLSRIADGLARKFPEIAPLTRATLAARVRLGSDEIGTCVSRGLFQVHHCHFPKGKTTATVTPLSEWLDLDAAIAFLNAMAPAD